MPVQQSTKLPESIASSSSTGTPQVEKIAVQQVETANPARHPRTARSQWALPPRLESQWFPQVVHWEAAEMDKTQMKMKIMTEKKETRNSETTNLEMDLLHKMTPTRVQRTMPKIVKNKFKDKEWHIVLEIVCHW